MVKLFIILIAVFAFLWANNIRALEKPSQHCSNGDPLVVTMPEAGSHTVRNVISIRGFVCENFPFVMVRNVTTHEEILTSTEEVCKDSGCVYPFYTLLRDLAEGSNEIEASIPNQDPPIQVEFEIIRTALASLSVGLF